MKMNLPLFIARRLYFGGDSRRRVSRPAIRIATIGVAVGLAVMIVSVGVVLGFKHTIRDKVTGMGSHIQVADFMTLQTAESYPIEMGDSMMNVLRKTQGVRHVQRFAMKQGILKTDSDFLGVVLKGVGPEYDTTFISQCLMSGSIPKFSDQANKGQLLISKQMADRLRIACGQRVFAYFIDADGVRPRRFTIAGIYQTNLEQYDAAICLTDLYTTVKLNGWEPDQASGAELTVDDFAKVDDTERILTRTVNRTIDKYGGTYSSKTIREISPQIFSWLDLLDLNVWTILGLMVMVSCVTMVSGLLIIILERTTMIGILKALGAKGSTIRHTFLWFAVFIIGRAMLIGNVLGIGLLLVQQYFGIVKLDPTKYYINTVTVETNPAIILAINAATLVISVFVLTVPSYLVTHIHPAKSMRYE